MVLESLVNPIKAERRPASLIMYGFFFNTVAILLSIWVFGQNASLVMVFLTTLAAVPLMYNTLKVEEGKDETIVDETSLLKEHWKALDFFIMLFIGMVASSVFWYIALPYSTSSMLFKTQLNTIRSINMKAMGNVVELTLFSTILLNNIKVMVFCLLFSFVYGAGAIFILSWNASVIGAAMGNLIRTELGKYASDVGLIKVGGYFKAASLGLMRYSIHGIPEVLAYFTAGLAAGIISVSMIRQGLDFKRFKHIVYDVTDLVILSVVLLLIAALLEVYVTPAFF